MVFYKTGTYTTTVNGYVGNLKIEVPLSIHVVPEGSVAVQTVMKLPAALTRIDAEAFRGVAVNIVDLSETKIVTIGAAAFRDCVDLQKICLPETVRSIAEDAFYGCLNAVFCCPEGSYAESFALSHGFEVIH